MKAEVDLNILSVGGLHNRPALTQWIADTAPHEAMLVMNDSPYAVELSPYVRHMIHRQQTADDQNLFDKMSPQQFVDGLPAIGNKIYHQILNEPGGGNVEEESTQRRMALWVSEAMYYARGRNIRLIGPAHAVGNPHESFYMKGVYDPILRAMRIPADTQDWHAVMQHEYFVTDPTAEQPYHIGRVFGWRTRARALGLPDPKVILGEAGRDVAGKTGPDGDGWKNATWTPKTPEEYWKRLKAQAQIYKAYGYPMLIFCVGEGFGDWVSFDIQNEPVIFTSIAAYNPTVPDVIVGVKPMAPVPLPPGTPVVPGKFVQMPSAFVNLREAPDTASTDVGDCVLNERVDYAEPTGYPEWFWVRKQNGIFGWVKKQSTSTTPVKIEPIPISPPSNQFTEDELRSLAQHHRDIADIFEAAADRI